MSRLDRALSYIRPAVRAASAYKVGGPPRASVKLNQNESPFDLPEHLKRTLTKRYWDEPWNRYPLIQPVALRNALAEQVGKDAEGVLVGNGSNELMSTVCQAVLGAGEPVVLPSPMFSYYAALATLREAAVVSVPSLEDLRFDVEGITRGAKESNAKLVVLTTPNSPTGLAMTASEVQAVVEVAPGLVLVDEAYAEFSPEPSALRLLDDYPNLLVLRTFSKAMGLAGLRIGYLVGHPRLIREIEKAHVPFMVNRLSEVAALELLKRPEMLQERIDLQVRGVQWLVNSLNGIEGVQALDSQTNFVLFRTPMVAESLMKALVREGVLIRNVSSYDGLAGYLRVSVGSTAENKYFIGALEAVLREQ